MLVITDTAYATTVESQLFGLHYLDWSVIPDTEISLVANAQRVQNSHATPLH